MATKKIIMGPDGKEIKGFPFAKDFASMYDELRKGKITPKRAEQIESQLERIVGDTQTHNNNEQTLHYIGVIKQEIQSCTIVEPVAPQAQIPVAARPRPKTIDDVYQPPVRYQEGDIVRIDSFEEPRKSGGDYSFSPKPGVRVFLSPDRPTKRSFVKLTQETRRGLFNSRYITIEEVRERLGIEEVVPDELYTRDLVDATGKIKDFTKKLSESLKALESPPKDSELEDFVSKANENYFSARASIATARLMTDRIAGGIPEETEYLNAVKIMFEQERKFNEGLGKLEKKAEGYKAQQAKKGYDVKLPDAAKPAKPVQEPKEPAKLEEKVDQGLEGKVDKTISQYAITLEIGRRTVTIIFPEKDLPKTEKDFIAYLRDSNNFPDRKDREVVQEFLKQDGTTLYNGQRIGPADSFTKAFRDYKSQITVEGKEKVKREAKVSEARRSTGGHIGYLL